MGNYNMIVKVLLALLLLGFIGVQCLFIFWLGGYYPKMLNQVLDLWEAFDVKIIPYTAFMLSISKTKAIWLLPKFNLIIGLWVIIKKEWYIGLLMVILSFVIAMAFVLAIYNPSMMIKLS